MRDYMASAPMPVVEDGRLVGIITESDIFDAFMEIMGLNEPGTRLNPGGRRPAGRIGQDR
jgi:acetoin utilization protein AcuB